MSENVATFIGGPNDGETRAFLRALPPTWTIEAPVLGGGTRVLGVYTLDIEAKRYRWREAR